MPSRSGSWRSPVSAASAERLGDAAASAQAAERAVAWTDFALGVEAAVFAVLIARQEPPRDAAIKGPLVTFFAATAAASLAGAALHGLTTEKADPRRWVLWRFALLSIGVASLSSWFLGARLALTSAASRTVTRLATIAHVPYAAAVLTRDPPFAVAIASYVPGALFLGGSLASRLRDRRHRRSAATALGALLITFAAAGVQVGRIGLTRRFDHNALYHTLQAIGVAVFYRAATTMLGEAAPSPRPAADQAGGRH